MKKLWLRICSLVLVLAMSAQLLPMNVFATSDQDSIATSSTASSTSTDVVVSEDVELTPEEGMEIAMSSKVLHELEEERTEFTKEFLLDSGLSMAVVYDSAVHFEQDGKWEEIDNTLQTKVNGTITNTAGVWDISFPQKISGSSEIIIKKDGHILSFAMAGELLQRGDLEIMSVGNATASNTDAVSDVTEVTQEESTEETTVATVVREETQAPEATEQEATEPEATEPEATEPEATEPEATETVPEETVPEATESEATTQGTIPEETEPEATVPEETTPEATVPETIAPVTDTQVDLIPEDNIVADDSIATVVVNGTVQTFAVNAAKVSSGSIQTLDHKEAFAAAEHKETVLTKPVSQLMYANVYTNTDIKYDLHGKQLKESVILESYKQNLRGYRFILNTGALVPVLEEDGSINLYADGNDEVVFHMPAPYLFDSNNEYNYDVQVALNGSAGEYTLTYLLPKQWLASSERSWPVVLDPVVAADLEITNTRDRTIMSDGTSSQTWGYGQIGYKSTSGINRFLLKYAELPELGVADVIVSARMGLVKHGTETGEIPIEVHKVTSEWESETVTWSNRPHWDTTIEDYAMFDDGGGWSYWDVTNIARSWYTDANNGMIFKASDSIETAEKDVYKQVYASEYATSYAPRLFIILRNSNGLEGYWDYLSTDAGRAGTGYVNYSTGNVVWVHNDIGFDGNRMPVSINHIYNANDRGVVRNGLGHGWRTNYNQRVYVYPQNEYYLVWDDEDGTKHFFYPKEGTTTIYVDEDGLEMRLKLRKNETYNRYEITDKQGNVSTFDSEGRLVKMTNNQAAQDTIIIEYTATTGHRIKQITDGAGRVYIFTYINNLLDTISYKGTGTSIISSISFAYNDENELTTITYPDGKQTNFTYIANNLLRRVYDNDGYIVRYGYYSSIVGKPNRIKNIQESFDNGTETVLGGQIEIEYAHNQTTFTDHNNNVQIVQFNNMGNTVAIQDSEGRAQYAKYAKNDASEETGKGNQLTASSKMQNTVNNLLLDSSFEIGNLWSTGEGISTGNTAYLGSKALSVTNATSTSPTFSVAAGESCTFSAYVKTESSNSSLKLMNGTTVVAQQEILEAKNWTRVEVNYINHTDAAQTLAAALTAGTGATVLMDCVQAEKYPTASRYNLINNADFSTTTGTTADGWTGSAYTLATVTDKAAPQLDGKTIKITGSPTAKKEVSQNVAVSGEEGDTFVVSGWAKADSVPIDTYDDGDREFAVQLIFNYTDGKQSDPFTARFNYAAHSDVHWQYASEVAVAKKAYDSVTVRVAYNYNANTAFFDGIQLYKEEFSESYTYDDDGNLTSVVDLQKETTTYKYEGNDLTEQMLPNGAKMTYKYDDYHNVIKATTTEGLVYDFTYDKYGNNTEVKISKTGSDGKAIETIKSTAYYGDPDVTTDKCNYLKYSTDATGKVTTYGYDENTGMLEWVQYPEDTPDTDENTQDGTITRYTYDNMYRMATAAATTDTGLALSAAYSYNGDLLTRIQTDSTVYDFAYGDFSLRSNIKIGSRTLASYTYTTDRNNYLSSLDYGNGDKVQYEYDDQGRVTKQTYEDGVTVEYRYDNTGALAAVTDSATGRTTTYYYDFLDRMMKYVERGNGYSHGVGYAYDEINNLTQLVETINGTDYATGYSYDQDNRVTSIAGGLKTTTETGESAIADAVIKDYSYDGFGRVSSQTTSQYDGAYVPPQPTEGEDGSEEQTEATPDPNKTTVKTDTFQFTAPSIPADDDDKTPRTSSQVSSHTIDTAGYDKTYAYTYDDNGNILTISDGTNTTSYVYDSANQLIRENNQEKGYTHTWTYDAAGNILVRNEYAYTTGEPGTPADTINYTYGDTSWGDLLTAYGGYTVYSDTIGNPVNIGTWSFDWQHGRQLARIAGMAEDGYVSTEFTYNADGIRTQKVVTPYELENVGTRTGLFLCSDGEIRYFTNGEPTYKGLYKDENDDYYYIGSSFKAIRGQDYWVSTTNGLVPGGSYTFGNDGRIVFDKTYGEDGELFSGLRTDADGETRYYMNGLPTYAGLVLVNGCYYYFNSNKVAVKNQTYTVTKTNDLLPEGTYTFDADGKMVNPPTTEETASTAAVMTMAASSGYQVWVPGTPIIYNYVYNGDKLSQMTVGTDTLNFFYDASGTPMAVKHNNTTYYYATNIQGDVIAILNDAGTAVVEYAYDAWGDPISTTLEENASQSEQTLSTLNPLRYRSYVFDSEYNFYYLQSRYYNTEVGRFLNADALAATGQGFFGNNTFAYCENNPVLKKDSNGELGAIALCALGGVAGALLDYAGQVIGNYSNGLRGSEMWSDVDVGSIVASTFSGALSAIPGAGFIVSAIDVVGSPAIEQGVNCMIDHFDNDPTTNREWDNGQYINDVLINTLSAGADELFQVGTDVPRYIRDIKSEARAKGVKGTKKLKKYLNTKQAVTVVSNAVFSDVMSRIYPWSSYQA